MIQCCRNCPDRSVGCHSTCEKYISEKAAHDELNEMIRDQKAQDDAITLSIINRSKKKGGRYHG